MMCIDMSFSVHNGKDKKKRASYIHDWMGKEGRNGLGILVRERYR